MLNFIKNENGDAFVEYALLLSLGVAFTGFIILNFYADKLVYVFLNVSQILE